MDPEKGVLPHIVYMFLLIFKIKFFLQNKYALFFVKDLKFTEFFFQSKPENGRLNKVIFNFQLHFVTKFVLADKVFFCKHLHLVISQLLDNIFQPFKEQN